MIGVKLKEIHEQNYHYSHGLYLWPFDTHLSPQHNAIVVQLLNKTHSMVGTRKPVVKKQDSKSASPLVNLDIGFSVTYHISLKCRLCLHPPYCPGMFKHINIPFTITILSELS